MTHYRHPATFRPDPRGRPVDPYDLDRRLRYVLAQQVHRERASLERPLYRGMAPQDSPRVISEYRAARVDIAYVAPPADDYILSQVAPPPPPPPPPPPRYHRDAARTQRRHEHYDEQRTYAPTYAHNLDRHTYAPRHMAQGTRPAMRCIVPDTVTSSTSSGDGTMSGSDLSASDTKDLIFDVFDSPPAMMHDLTSTMDDPRADDEAMRHLMQGQLFSESVNGGGVRSTRKSTSEKDRLSMKQRLLPFLARQPEAGDQNQRESIMRDATFYAVQTAPAQDTARRSNLFGLFRRQS